MKRDKWWDTVRVESIERRDPSTSAMDDIGQKRLRGMNEIGTKKRKNGALKWERDMCDGLCRPSLDLS